MVSRKNLKIYNTWEHLFLTTCLILLSLESYETAINIEWTHAHKHMVKRGNTSNLLSNLGGGGI